MCTSKQIKKAVLTLSGGQDTSTCLVLATQWYGYEEIHAITFDYDQTHASEIEAAKKIASNRDFKVASHKIIKVNTFKDIVSSSLLLGTKNQQIDTCLPASFVPGRNAMFFNIAAMHAYTNGIRDIIVGICAQDRDNYPDCTKEFIESFEKAINLGLGLSAKENRMNFIAPLLNLTKAQTWAVADICGQLDFIRNNTVTCYNGYKGEGCGNCMSCKLRNEGFDEYKKNREHIIQDIKKQNLLR